MPLLTADRERFMPGRTIAGEDLAPTTMPELQVVLEGVFEKSRFLQLLRHFIVFEDEGGGKLVKKMAGYHQFHAVNLALASTLRATAAGGDRRVGVVWHTQGSGKSLTMAFDAGRVISTRRCGTRRSWSSPTGTTWTTNSSAPSPGARNYSARSRCRPNPRYRRMGLPTTSSLVESLVGEFNARVKSKPKHWNRPAGAESILQLRAALLSEDGRLGRHFANRPGCPFRKRHAGNKRSEPHTTQTAT